jgi:shikimate kinase
MSRTLVAEIVGPAGAGKSTLARAIKRSGAGVRAGLSVWGLPKRLLLASACASLPQLVGLWCGGRPVGLEEAKMIVRLKALGRRIGRESSRRHKLLLLDEGTVFALAKLRARADGGVGRLRDLVERCAGNLDAVVWLDAPDAVLARRIRERDKPHRMKACTDEEIAAFIARYRAGYEWAVAEMCARRDLKIIRVSTEGETPERVAEQVLSIIAGEVAARGPKVGYGLKVAGTGEGRARGRQAEIGRAG